MISHSCLACLFWLQKSIGDQPFIVNDVRKAINNNQWQLFIKCCQVQFFFLQLTYSPSASTPTTRCQGSPGTSGAATAVSVIASSPVATRSLLMTIKAVVVTIIIIIIINRPKPAYGRQGLAGSWGQDTDEVSAFLVFLTSHFVPTPLSSDLTNLGPLMTMKIHLETLKNNGNQPKTMKPP